MTNAVLIFGATGGVGSALARDLAANGQDLFLTARDEARLAGLAEELGCRYGVCDVTDPEKIAAVVEEAAEKGLSGLVYCVGSIVLKPIKAAKPADFLEAFQLNAVGAAEAVRCAAPALQESGGSVVLFSTVAVQQGFASHAVVSAAKGGVEGLTRALAAELAPQVRVNAIAPSLTKTNMAEPLIKSEAMAKGLAQMHPLGRLGQAEDIAGLAAYLLSDKASWMTGQVIGLDGGRGALRTKGA